MEPVFLAAVVDYLRRGGMMMLPIIAVSLAMWWFILLKYQQLAAAERREMEVLAAVRLAAADQAPPSPASPLGRLVAAFVARRAADRRLNAALLASLVEREKEQLADQINYIYVLASVAPLLGLLGTVGGMIGTFDAIAVFGTGNARAMAGGISKALITTQSGLFVSIPGLFMASLLQRRLGRIVHRLEEFRTAMVKKMAAAAAGPTAPAAAVPGTGGDGR